MGVSINLSFRAIFTTEQRVRVEVSYFRRFDYWTTIPTPIIKTHYALQDKTVFSFVIKYQLAQTAKYSTNERVTTSN